ncbi:uncharacterized protein LOC141665879 [Apium graveolens]|uniref:uncharacterized protein LOC141665879 n=1 Tax=Apium graveolens TaxID=4045 RepID=UPI003D7AEA6F
MGVMMVWCLKKNVDKMVFEDHDTPEEPRKDDNVGTDEESVYARSDDERMSPNSTDEDEPNFSEFNKDVDLKRPVFELGMLFKSSQIFKKAVRNHAIMERRPIELVKNYGRKIKYVCKKPLEVSKHAVYRAKTRALLKINGTNKEQFGQGLINALEGVVPNAEHKFCVMHLYQNMHKEFKGLIVVKCHEWLMVKPKTQWTRAAFRTHAHTDIFVNNHCEVFNSSIRNFRDLAIITMFRELHKSVMKRIQVRRDKFASMKTVICPSALKKLEKAIQYAGNCAVSLSGGTKYLVTCTDGGHELVVDLHNKICT